jgi:peptide/nickel transport system permease protein
MTIDTLKKPHRAATRSLSSPRFDATTTVLVGIVLSVIFIAVAGPLIAPHDPTASNLSLAHAGPSLSHPLGFDSQGRDLLSRLLAGARSAMLGPAIAVLLAVVFGTTLAIIASWAGGWVDSVISTILDILFAFPSILLAILAVTVFGRGLVAPSIALAIAYTPYIARIVRSAGVVERNRPYISALELQGFSGLRIAGLHLVPNLVPLIIAQSTVIFGYAIIDFAGVSFLGLGVQPPDPDWGAMISTGQGALLQGYPMQSITAGIAVIVAVVAVNLLGERLVHKSRGPHAH